MKKKILATLLSLILIAGCFSTKEVQNHRLVEITNTVVYEEDGKYCAWPMVIQADNKDLIVSFCRAEEHHSPTGEMVLIRSTDLGNTWSKPRTIRNTPLDDREGSMLKPKDGRIFASMKSAYHPTEIFSESFVKSNSYPLETLKRWAEYTRTPEYKAAKSTAGYYNYLSTDNGISWKELGLGNGFLHNAVELNDGTLLLPYYQGNNLIFISRANIKQEPLRWLCDTIKMPLTKSYQFGEPDILKLKNGRIILLLRSTALNPYDNGDFKNIMWETYSDDDGKTWVELYPIPIWGYPPHLLQLADGRVLLTYGYRRVPYGERACISSDGVTWKAEDEIILRDDAPNEDLGYPVSIEIEPGKIFTIYYQPNVPRGTLQTLKPPQPDRKKPGILGTFWRLPTK